MNPLPPAYAPDAPLSELRTVETLLVTTVRLWALRHMEPEAGHPDWQSGLIAAGADADAIAAFGGLLAIVAAVPRRSLDVRCTCCSTLGADEGRFLQIIGFLQRDLRQSAGEIMADWLPPAALLVAMFAAHALAAALVRCDVIIPARCPTVDRLRTAAVPACADPGLVRVQ